MKNTRALHLLIFISFLLKACAYLHLKYSSGIVFGGGNDADYYDLYALNPSDVAANYWPVMLSKLNEWGLYSRDGVSVALFLISLTILPYVCSKCVGFGGGSSNKLNRLLMFSLVALYPTIFFYALDVFRDTVMFLIFALSIFFAKKFYESTSIKKFLFLFFYLAVCGIAFAFRQYLGFALLLAPVVAWFHAKLNPRLIVVVSIYLVVLVVVNASGYLEPLLVYRGEDGFDGGGASLGIGLVGRNPLDFAALFVWSFFAQVFGTFFVSASSIIVFIVESVPFIFALKYVLGNIRNADRYSKFLIVFFVIYTTIWVVGNDNLGTAVRLRVPSYIAIFLCYFNIKSKKYIG